MQRLDCFPQDTGSSVQNEPLDGGFFSTLQMIPINRHWRLSYRFSSHSVMCLLSFPASSVNNHVSGVAIH